MGWVTPVLKHCTTAYPRRLLLTRCHVFYRQIQANVNNIKLDLFTYLVILCLHWLEVIMYVYWVMLEMITRSTEILKYTNNLLTLAYIYGSSPCVWGVRPRNLYCWRNIERDLWTVCHMYIGHDIYHYLSPDVTCMSCLCSEICLNWHAICHLL